MEHSSFPRMRLFRSVFVGGNQGGVEESEKGRAKRDLCLDQLFARQVDWGERREQRPPRAKARLLQTGEQLRARGRSWSITCCGDRVGLGLAHRPRADDLDWVHALGFKRERVG